MSLRRLWGLTRRITPKLLARGEKQWHKGVIETALAGLEHL